MFQADVPIYFFHHSKIAQFQFHQQNSKKITSPPQKTYDFLKPWTFSIRAFFHHSGGLVIQTSSTWKQKSCHEIEEIFQLRLAETEPFRMHWDGRDDCWWLVFWGIPKGWCLSKDSLGFKLYIPLSIFTFHCGMGENMSKEWGFNCSSLWDFPITHPGISECRVILGWRCLTKAGNSRSIDINPCCSAWKWWKISNFNFSYFILVFGWVEVFQLSDPSFSSTRGVNLCKGQRHQLGTSCNKSWARKWHARWCEVGNSEWWRNTCLNIIFATGNDRATAFSNKRDFMGTVYCSLFTVKRQKDTWRESCATTPFGHQDKELPEKKKTAPKRVYMFQLLSFCRDIVGIQNGASCRSQVSSQNSTWTMIQCTACNWFDVSIDGAASFNGAFWFPFSVACSR